MTLRWDFDSQGQWEAASRYHDDGVPFTWRIGVCDDGTFAVNESDSELTDSRETFSSLDAAKAFCQYKENIEREQSPKHHPTPWRVEYYQRCPEWHKKSCPRIKDANNCLVVDMPQNVGHPGSYDFIADQTAGEIVAAMNATQLTSR